MLNSLPNKAATLLCGDGEESGLGLDASSDYTTTTTATTSTSSTTSTVPTSTTTTTGLNGSSRGNSDSQHNDDYTLDLPTRPWCLLPPQWHRLFLCRALTHSDRDILLLLLPTLTMSEIEEDTLLHYLRSILRPDQVKTLYTHYTHYTVFLTVGAMSALVLNESLGEKSPEIIRVLAELTLIVVLFHDASTVHWKELYVGLPLRLLCIGLPITLTSIYYCVKGLMPELGIYSTLLIAAALTPTDAGLGAPTILNPKGMSSTNLYNYCTSVHQVRLFHFISFHFILHFQSSFFGLHFTSFHF